MMKCRACLTTDGVFFPIDDEFVYNYNILTSLDVKTTDILCQFVCEPCSQSVKLFMEFREKCILSEVSLRSSLQQIKQENLNIKEEYEADNKDNMFLESLDFSDSNTVDNFDVKDEKCDNDYEPTSTKRKVKVRQCRKKQKYVKAEAKEVKTNNWLCGLCPKEFENKNALVEHFDDHKTTLKCQICNLSFKDWPPLVSHRLEHLPPGRKVCHLCPKRFQSLQNFEFHIRKIHFGQMNYQVECSICLKKYNTPRRLSKHMQAIHSNKSCVCDICNKVCRSKPFLRVHIISHMEAKHVCDVCDFSCKYKSGLKRHKLRKHAADKVVCPKCRQPFDSQSAYDRHKCNIPVSVICPICGVQISGTKSMPRHLETHMEEGRHKCTRCSKTYRAKGALRAHMDRHDNNPRQQCEFCPAKFFHPSALIKHRRRHTGEKPYVCKICQRGFTGNNNLKVHMKVHGINNLINKKTKPEQTETEEI